jgi:hypothetical protein
MVQDQQKYCQIFKKRRMKMTTNQKLELLVKPIKDMPVLESNIDDLTKLLETRLVKYKNLVVTEEDIKGAKSDRANLNKLKKALSDERIAQKKRFLTPFEEFEKKCKNAEKLIDDASSSIDIQIKTFEEKEKEAKANEIHKIYNENFAEYSKLVPLSKIWDDKWLNTTFTLKKIEETIKELKAQIDDHIKIIDNLKSEFVEQLKDTYFNTLDLASVLSENERLYQRKRDMEELEKLREQQRNLFTEAVEFAKEEAPQEVIEAAPEVIDVVPTEVVPQNEIAEKEELVTQVFKVVCTKSQLNALGKFMQENGIKYGKA